MRCRNLGVEAFVASADIDQRFARIGHAQVDNGTHDDGVGANFRNRENLAIDAQARTIKCGAAGCQIRPCAMGEADTHVSAFLAGEYFGDFLMIISQRVEAKAFVFDNSGVEAGLPVQANQDAGGIVTDRASCGYRAAGAPSSAICGDDMDCGRNAAHGFPEGLGIQQQTVRCGAGIGRGRHSICSPWPGAVIQVQFMM